MSEVQLIEKFSVALDALSVNTKHQSEKLLLLKNKSKRNLESCLVGKYTLQDLNCLDFSCLILILMLQ